MLSDVDCEHEDNIKDCLSWDKSDHKSNEVSDFYSEISANESDSKENQDGESREILGKDGCVITEAKSCQKNTNAKYYQRETRTQRE
jgi:hypothetical protein